MSKILLDTGPVIRHLRGERRYIQMVRNLGKLNRLAISVVSRMEIYAGLREEDLYRTRKLLSRFISLDMDQAVAERAGNLIRNLTRKNVHVSFPDAAIAATAMAHNLTLFTLNLKHFEQIPGLSLYPAFNLNGSTNY